jgi:hypothetical protein
MVDENLHKSAVTPYRLTQSMAQKRIREAATNSDNVIFGDHALERMEERGIFDVSVFEILKTGVIDGNPEITEYKEWKCKMVKKLRGSREAGVITVILHNGRLFIKTVEWEDQR